MLDTIWLALVAAIVHHFTVQYPNQVNLFKTLLVFVFLNAIFLVLEVKSRSQSAALSSQMSVDVFIFNTVYVSHFSKCSNSQTSAALLIKTVYNVYFRHRGIPGK